MKSKSHNLGVVVVLATTAIVSAPSFAQLDDALQPIGPSQPAAPHAVVCDDDKTPLPGIGQTTTQRLANLTAAEQANSRIDLEPLRGATPQDRLTAARAAALWNDGHYDAALAALSGLENQHAMALGISWIEPPVVEGGIAGFSDVTINAEDAVGTIALDINKTNGNLYCVVQVASGWNLYRSTTAGLSWTNPYSWSGASGAEDVDAAVVDDLVYVGYVATDSFGDLSDLRVRRADALTGAIDATYGFLIAYDASPATIEEVAVATNAEDFQNRIYLFSLKSNDTVGYHWAVAATGTAWTTTAAAVSNAESGLDATWNPNYADYYLHLSYIGNDTTVREARYDGTWTNAIVEATYDGTALRTAISAWEETIIVGYRDDQTNGFAFRYRISYNAGDTWSFGDLYVPAVGGDNVINFDVCARGGFGTAAVYELETGEPDQVWFLKRPGYAPGAWDAEVQINNDDVFTGTVLEPDLNWVSTIDGSSNNYRFGIVYPQPDPTYDRRQHCDGDVDGSGTVDADDVVEVILGWGACAACPPSCEADITPFGGNCNVDADDLVEVILNWGACP
jgi:hypothetical protein